MRTPKPSVRRRTYLNVPPVHPTARRPAARRRHVNAETGPKRTRRYIRTNVDQQIDQLDSLLVTGSTNDAADLASCASFVGFLYGVRVQISSAARITQMCVMHARDGQNCLFPHAECRRPTRALSPQLERRKFPEYPYETA
jgi:hypothetical protein